VRVALVNLPWALPDRPSIQCGLLKARLQQEGHKVTVHYLNLDLAALLGPNLYLTIAEAGQKRTIMLGEWLFTVAAFGDRTDDETYRVTLPAIDDFCAESGLSFQDLCDLRRKALPDWLDGAVGRIPWSDFEVVGFSSTFDQQVAVLAAAAKVKQLAPAVPLVVGGANVDGEMGPEYLRYFTDIDYVVVGEGDDTLPQLVAEISHGRDPAGIVGLCHRDSRGEVRPASPRLVRSMDDLPKPDYSDYFDSLESLGAKRVLGERPVRLLAEFSRGCWWGEKHHCTFCGLNGLGMEYRSKSAKRAVEEILELTGSWKWLGVDAVDNILDMQYITTFCEELAPHGLDISLFFEVKANLSAKQVGQLRKAGVGAIQPGIESLSTNVLKIMDKGTDMLTNVRLLKWAHQYGIFVGWNVLTGFPDETDEDYLSQAELIPSLYHLPPPGGISEIWLERFSPLYNKPPEAFLDIRPAAAYSLIYPFRDLDLAKIAYFFDYRVDSAVTEAARHELREAVGRWQRRWRPGSRPPTLFCERGPGWIRLKDKRGADPVTVTYDGWRAAAYLACGDSPRTAAALARQLDSDLVESPAESEVADFLGDCVQRRLMATERGRHLSLAHLLPR
jgi:ribosomal peptide maturation radical SAM protein 1